MSLRFFDNWLRKVDSAAPTQRAGKPSLADQAARRQRAAAEFAAYQHDLATHDDDCACMICLMEKHPRGHDPACWCVAYHADADERRRQHLERQRAAFFPPGRAPPPGPLPMQDAWGGGQGVGPTHITTREESP